MAAAMALPAVTPAPAIWRQQQRRRFKRQPPPPQRLTGLVVSPPRLSALKGRKAAGELGLQFPVYTASAGQASGFWFKSPLGGCGLRFGWGTRWEPGEGAAGPLGTQGHKGGDGPALPPVSAGVERAGRWMYVRVALVRM